MQTSPIKQCNFKRNKYWCCAFFNLGINYNIIIKMNSLEDRPKFAPGVIEGGPRRCQRQTLPKLISLPGHLAELQ